MSLLDKYCRTDFSSYEDFRDNFKIKVPENFNFAYDVIDELARTRPDKRALVWCNDKGDERTFTFADIKRISDKTANLFLSLGLVKGDRVMLTLKRNWQYWTAMMALHKIGVIAIPATHMLTVKDIIYRVEMANVRMILTSDDEFMISNIAEAEHKMGRAIELKAVTNACGLPPEGFIDFDARVEDADEHFERPCGEDDTRNDDLLLIYFTSGTTGMPKMVMHTHTYPLGHIVTAKFWHQLRDDDLHLTVADTGWAKCSWGKMYGQWMCEATLFVYDYDQKFHPLDLLRMIEKYRVTVFCAPPTVFRFLIKEDLSGFDLSSLRHCATAGEPLNPEVFKRWKEITGLEIKEGFGQTETCIIIGTFTWVKPKTGSTGLPNPHFKIHIINENGEEAEIGEVGEICADVREGIPAGLTIGYMGDDEKTASSFADGYYHTGDMAWRDEDNYIWFEGRSDDVIKSSGYRIGPFEVESALLEHPAVVEAAITAVPDPVRGQIVKATVVLVKDEKYRPSSELIKELQNHVKRVTAPYKYPRIIEFVDELPKTTSGKIKRGEIRKSDAEGR